MRSRLLSPVMFPLWFALAVACGDTGSGAGNGGDGSGASLGFGECAFDGDCGTADPFCVGGECVECADAADCRAGESCFPRDHECDTRCESDNDCTRDDEPFCDVVSGACIGCFSGGDHIDGSSSRVQSLSLSQRVSHSSRGKQDSPARQSASCFPRDHECDTRCESDNDCTRDDEPFCDVVSGACIGCFSGGDCPAGDPICSALTQQCAECEDAGDCGAAEPFCDVADGECRQCMNDGDCRSGEVCDDGECVICLSDNDCTDPMFPICKGGDECVECDDDNHCEPGFQCNDQRCERD